MFFFYFVLFYEHRLPLIGSVTVVACKASRYSFLSQESDDDAALDPDYVESDEETMDGVLSIDGEYEEDEEGSEGELEEARSLYEEHKKSFYALYAPMYDSVKTSTHLITDEKYSWILGILQAAPVKQDSMAVRKIWHVYALSGNVERNCVFHDGKKVTTYESVFDVILTAHRKIGHARDVKKNKDTVNDDLKYYGVPRAAVKCFIDTCPIVSLSVISASLASLLSLLSLSVVPFFFLKCASNINKTKIKQQPLKMILSKRVGSRYQMDLIEMPPFKEYRYILRIVDHLSQYGFVQPLQRRTAEQVGKALITVLSAVIIPDILQSDNGSEVCKQGWIIIT
jgi:hypothetical protein